jgi:tripartite-type tricarboxylate transporter receptor subunit TctC
LGSDYPSRPIRVVVPYPPGGPTDIVARITGQKLGESMGQQVVVDNRAGAGGLIGTDIVAKAAPDGYTVLITAVPHVVNPSLFKKVPYDARRDFSPVVKLITYSNILIVNRALAANSVSELIQLAKRTPGTLNYGSGGNGTSQHLSAELFKSMAKVEMVHIPFQGGAAAMTALQSGQVSIMFETTLAALSHVKAGRVKALAVTSAQRSPLTPDLPTIAESGLPGYEVTSWVGVLLPAHTSLEVVKRLNSECNRMLEAPDIKVRISELGGVPAGGTPEQLGGLISAELSKWSDVVKIANMKVD